MKYKVFDTVDARLPLDEAGLTRLVSDLEENIGHLVSEGAQRIRLKVKNIKSSLYNSDGCKIHVRLYGEKRSEDVCPDVIWSNLSFERKQ